MNLDKLKTCLIYNHQLETGGNKGVLIQTFY